MSQIILSINAGSSSLKCSLYSANTGEKKLNKLASAEVSAIGDKPAHFKYTRAGDKQQSDLNDVNDHKKAFEHVLDSFLNDKKGGIQGKDEILFAAHRVVRRSTPSALPWPLNPTSK
jgi:acetate kinase